MAPLSEEFYEFITEDSEPRACRSIPDEDCTHVPRNFSLNVANGTLSKLAEKIISPNLTLPWILSFLQAPPFLIGMLVPIKDAGSLLPQLLVSGKIRAKNIRKHYWTGAALLQGFCMLVSAALLYFSEGSWLPWLLVGLLALFSLGSGIGSVAFKDVSAKTVPKGQRGQMLSYRSTFGGIMGLLAGILLIWVIRDVGNRTVYASMFLVAGLLWWGAALLFHLIEELPGATKGGRNPVEELKGAYRLVRSEKGFRRFIITRALLMAIPLSQPFYVVISKDLSGNSWSQIGYLIVVSGIAQVVSSPFWGRTADHRPRLLMRIVSGLSILATLYASLFLLMEELNSFYWFLPVYFVHGMAYAGARLSRKTYLVDYAPEEERPTYVSVANTLIGLFTLVAAGFGLIAQYYGLLAQLYFFAGLLLLCVVLSFQLKKV